MSKTTNRTDRLISISLAIAYITFLVQIVCAFLGDRNIIAPWNMFIYMTSTLVLMYTVIDKDCKWTFLRILGGAVLLWGILIIFYIGILALKEIL